MKTWAVPRSYWKIPENGLFWWYQVKNHTPQDLRQYVSLCISLQSISVCAPSFNSPCRVVIQWSDPRSAIWVPPAFLMPSMPFNVISLRMLVSTFLGRSTLPVPRRQISKTSRHQQHDLVGGFSPYPSEKWWSESQLGWLSHIMENITSFFFGSGCHSAALETQLRPTVWPELQPPQPFQCLTGTSGWNPQFMV